MKNTDDDQRQKNIVEAKHLIQQKCSVAMMQACVICMYYEESYLTFVRHCTII